MACCEAHSREPVLTIPCGAASLPPCPPPGTQTVFPPSRAHEPLQSPGPRREKGEKSHRSQTSGGPGIARPCLLSGGLTPFQKTQSSPTGLISAAKEQPYQSITSQVSVRERHIYAVLKKKTLPSQIMLMKTEERLPSFVIFHGFLITLRLTVQSLEGKSDRRVHFVLCNPEPLYVILVFYM